MVHPDSHRISRVLWYSGTAHAAVRFRLRDYHPLWSVIPHRFDYLITDRFDAALQPQSTEVDWFGLNLPISLAATPGISIDFSSSGY
jgi:hypothetical protein